MEQIPSSSSFSSITPSITPKEAEKNAYQTIQCIKLIINMLRSSSSIPAFQTIDVVHPSKLKQQRGSIQDQKRKMEEEEEEEEMRNVPLYSILCNATTIEDEGGGGGGEKKTMDAKRRTLMEDINHLVSLFDYNVPMLLSTSVEEEEEEEDDERLKVVYKILHPLLSSLAHWYNILDSLPTPPPPQLPSSSNKNTRKQQQKKPPPPPGILSLKDYTDIAIFLEYVACTSLLPNLESGIVYNVKDRITKKLPKSLGGRLPLKCFLWGSTVTTTIVNNNNNNTSTDDDKQEEKIKKMKKATNELYQTSTLLRRVILLDRFRPMLMTRHLCDLYACFFQMQRFTKTLLLLSQRQQQNQQQLKKVVVVLVVEENMEEMTRFFLPFSSSSSSSSTTTRAQEQQQQQQQQYLDYKLIATTFQTLLLPTSSSSTTTFTPTPKWLRIILSNHLSYLSTVDLDTVIDVFVSMAHSIPTETMSGAANRLARALMVVPISSSGGGGAGAVGAAGAGRKTPKGGEKTIKKEEEEDYYWKKLCQQLILVLDSMPKNNNNGSSVVGGDDDDGQMKTKDIANIMTIWAVLSNLSIKILQKYLLPHLVFGLFVLPRATKSNKEGTMLKKNGVTQLCVRRLSTLLSHMPKNDDGGITKICHLFTSSLSSDDGDDDDDETWRKKEKKKMNVSLFGQVLRLASSDSDSSSSSSSFQSGKNSLVQELSSSSISSSDATKKDEQEMKEEAIWILRMMVHAMLLRQQTTKTNIDQKTTMIRNDSNNAKKKSGIQNNANNSDCIGTKKGASLSSAASLSSSSRSSTSSKEWHVAIMLAQAICVNPYDQSNYKFTTTTTTTNNKEENKSICWTFEKQPQEEPINILHDGKDEEEKRKEEELSKMVHLITNMEYRARIIIEHVVLPLFQQSHHRINSNNNNGKGEGGDVAVKNETPIPENSIDCSNLPAAFFRLLLFIYFSTTTSSSSALKYHHLDMLPKNLMDNQKDTKLMSMVTLPLLCEVCPPDALLLGTVSGEGNENKKDTDGSGVLEMIALILQSAAAATTSSSIPYAQEENNDSINDNVEGIKKDIYKSTITEEEKETLQSTTMLILTLLVAMLELGTSKRRSSQEEELLQSMIPSLRILSVIRASEFGVSDLMRGMISDDDDDDHDEGEEFGNEVMGWAKLAEVSSHAMALISSRSVEQEQEEQQDDSRTGTTVEEVLFKKIRQAEDDLLSDQPPIRARGVVSLRHIVRGYFDREMNTDASMKMAFGDVISSTQNSEKKKPLIIEMTSGEKDQEGSRRINRNNNSNPESPIHSIHMIENLLRICLDSLKDTESYVFLAAIQTLVAIGDACPSEVIPRLGKAVSSSAISLAKITCPVSSLSDTNAKYDVILLKLSCAQRIKAAEALLFTIRRRGRGVYIFGKSLLYTMMYGVHENEVNDKQEQENSKVTKLPIQGSLGGKIQSQTHDYFRRGNQTNEDEDEPSTVEEYDAILEERQLRVNTGGPLFDTEEDDAVRAACISVVSELVSVLHPEVVARHCHEMIRLGTEALRLDASRPVRRAASLLCRELYTCVLREIVAAEEEGDRDAKVISVAMEMTSSGEDVLHAALKRCVDADDVDQIGQHSATIHVVQGKDRLYDSATVARCQEALDARDMAEKMGIFAAATLAINAKKNDEKDPVARLLRQARNKRKNKHRTVSGSDEEEAVHPVKGLPIDFNTLQFLD